MLGKTERFRLSSRLVGGELWTEVFPLSTQSWAQEPFVLVQALGAPWEPQAPPREYVRSSLVLRGTGSYRQDPVTRKPQLQTLAKNEKACSLGARIVDVVLQLGGRPEKQMNDAFVGKGACRGIAFYNTVARSLDAQALINAAAERNAEFDAVIPDVRSEGQHLYKRVDSAWFKPIRAFELGGKTVVLTDDLELKK